MSFCCECFSGRNSSTKGLVCSGKEDRSIIKESRNEELKQVETCGSDSADPVTERKLLSSWISNNTTRAYVAAGDML